MPIISKGVNVNTPFLTQLSSDLFRNVMAAGRKKGDRGGIGGTLDLNVRYTIASTSPARGGEVRCGSCIVEKGEGKWLRKGVGRERERKDFNGRIFLLNLF